MVGNVKAKKLIMRPFVKGYLKKQQKNMFVTSRYIQGNYIMKPIPEEDFIDFIHSEEKCVGGGHGNEILLA